MYLLEESKIIPIKKSILCNEIKKHIKIMVFTSKIKNLNSLEVKTKSFDTNSKLRMACDVK